MTRIRPITDDDRRATRRAHMDRLRALEAPTASQRALLRGLARFDAADATQPTAERHPR
jgi:hypothetical protein